MNEEELLKRLALNIKVERIIKSLTQEKLAEFVNVHEKYIGKVESGKQNLTLKTLNRIANALDIDIVRLFEKRN